VSDVQSGLLHVSTGVAVWKLPGEELRESLKWLNATRARQGLRVVDQAELTLVRAAVSVERGRIVAMAVDEAKHSSTDEPPAAKPETTSDDAPIGSTRNQAAARSGVVTVDISPDVEALLRRRKSRLKYY